MTRVDALRKLSEVGKWGREKNHEVIYIRKIMHAKGIQMQTRVSTMEGVFWGMRFVCQIICVCLKTA